MVPSSACRATLVIVIITLAYCSADPKPPPAPTVAVTEPIPVGSNHLHDDAPKDHDHEPENFGDSVVHFLLAAISPFRVDHDETKTSKAKDKDVLSKPVPDIELEKLKAAAKSSGLSDSKANRVRRAVTLLGADYNDIKELRKAYSDPTITAEYGDWMRTALEHRCIYEEERRSIAAAEASPIPVTPDELQRLKTAAKLSGLQEKELDALAKTLEASKLSKEQLRKLEEAIVHHGPTPVDLKKLTEQLAKVRQGRGAGDEDNEYDWSNPTFGSDWLFAPGPDNSAAAAPAADKAKSSTAT